MNKKLAILSGEDSFKLHSVDYTILPMRSDFFVCRHIMQFETCLAKLLKLKDWTVGNNC